ncbi:hypothetical protein E2C01_058456 [Portunus trituberculatus]|uniref:Uncharacterized protein n=1 Tax=Portunus trituberculatus TaxID=210409 RepID=A0A5B7GZV0_PORTR|nr:hypothetical protein [Portunus trituberculatus]
MWVRSALPSTASRQTPEWQCLGQAAPPSPWTAKSRCYSPAWSLGSYMWWLRLLSQRGQRRSGTVRHKTRIDVHFDFE